ncbi:type III secretion system inner rod subunit SctI [Dyella sp. Tek66A03]|uniref:type III secretion system inner rod subunit SctI n=1 Tax=Dyella sp. Tek66A03 TaxID=3458298 RepID=UPI00403E6AC5
MNISSLAIGLPSSDGFLGSTSLADRFAHAYVDAGCELAAIKQTSNDPRVASNPESLFDLQSRLEHYTKNMIVTAGLANNAAKTVETLLKS